MRSQETFKSSKVICGLPTLNDIEFFSSISLMKFKNHKATQNQLRIVRFSFLIKICQFFLKLTKENWQAKPTEWVAFKPPSMDSYDSHKVPGSDVVCLLVKSIRTCNMTRSLQSQIDT